MMMNRFLSLCLSVVLFAAPAMADELFPLAHCRIIDTRFSTPPTAIQIGQEYVFSAMLADNTPQGGEALNCGVPPGASAILASVVTINPAGPGYLKAWDTCGVEPAKATALNFFKQWDVAVPNYPISPGRLALIKLSAAGTFSVESYWFGAGALAVDVEGYLMP